MMRTLTDQNFIEEVLDSQTPVVVEFCVNWSGTCHIIAPILEAMAAQYENRIKFCAVDMETCKTLAERFGVSEIPTVLFFKNGHTFDEIVGVFPKRLIEQKLNEILQNEDCTTQ